MDSGSLSLPQILQRHGYEIVRSIGSKCFPSCLQVYHPSFNENFVCKIVTKKVNFEKELYALSVLDHPNIVRLYSHFVENDTYFLILEYCDGGNLETMIKSRTRPKQDKIISYTKQIVSALKYIHSKKFAHHDLKPSNILFDKYGRLKIADFGLSVQYETNSSKYFVGSYGYLAPEQRMNQIYDPFVADIWSLGVTLYYMTCGYNPFLQQKNTYKYFIPMYVEKMIADIISGALEIDPAKRINIDGIQAIFTAKPRLTIPSNSWYNIPVTDSLKVPTPISQLKHRKSTLLNF
ncbi:CAMK family protein kinase [Trichomonas vaginalis G3]|uniref:CAMK family protein kinase n=1 Tax=Trichomonas vaginalis (strain ATCC PRA-98 / G3) TaxID=412133 RepID=A2EQP2_TRIV3|nr:protein serine/threonine kinase protein [Trichomonas vaginalis G3]EAY05007.1 CAMK family protein kinase [Trichomonas vaginalis G3]KAI5502969.1 protein serine/threonine kinase protein [Trichomonas vaginalis G3]|eukprot:XP_001317230.1 CAMK family protein kinase [Trichomonas vaginalis G3]